MTITPAEHPSNEPFEDSPSTESTFFKHGESLQNGPSALRLSPALQEYSDRVKALLEQEAPLEKVLRWDREKMPPLAVLRAMVQEGLFVSGVPIPEYQEGIELGRVLHEEGLVPEETIKYLEREPSKNDLQKREFLKESGHEGHARAMGIAAMLTAKHAGVGIGTFMGVSTGLSAQTIFRLGTPSQQAFFLNALHEGSFTYSFALTEAGIGSDARGIRTTFTKEVLEDGKTYYRLNGDKKFIGNAAQVIDSEGNVVHRGADFLLVFAVDDRSKPPKDRVFHCFMVPRECIGEENIRTTGGECNKTGLREVNNGDFDLIDVPVPESCVLGVPDENIYPKLMGTLDVTRFLVGAMGIGAADAALEIAEEYASKRIQNGAPIIEYPLISGPLDELKARVHVGKLLITEAARLVDQADRETCELEEKYSHSLTLLMEMKTNLEKLFKSHNDSSSEARTKEIVERCIGALPPDSGRVKLRDRKANLRDGVKTLQTETKLLLKEVDSQLTETVKGVYRRSRNLLKLVNEMHEPVRFSTETALAKLYGSELAQKAIRQARQTLGGRSFLENEEGLGLGKRERDAEVLSIYEGENNMQRLLGAQGTILHQLSKLKGAGSLRQKVRHVLQRGSFTKGVHYGLLMESSNTPVERANAAFKCAAIDIMKRFEESQQLLTKQWEHRGVPAQYSDWDEASIQRELNKLATNPLQLRFGILADIATERKLMHLASREIERLRKLPDDYLSDEGLKGRELCEIFQVFALEELMNLVNRLQGNSLRILEARSVARLSGS